MINTRWIPYHKEYWFRNKFQQNFLRLHSSMAEIVYNPLDLWNGMRKIFKFYWSWGETESDKWQTQTRSGPKFEPNHSAINQNIANGTIHNCGTVMLRKPIFCVCDNHMHYTGCTITNDRYVKRISSYKHSIAIGRSTLKPNKINHSDFR